LQDGLHEKGSYLIDVAILQLNLRPDLRYGLLEIVPEGSYQLATTLCYKLFTFLHDKWRHDVVMMEGWNFNLNSFDSVPSNVSYLSVSTSRKLGSAKFEGNNPFDLRFYSRILRVRRNIWDAQAPKREAACLIACVDSLDLLEGDITTRLFSL
jgi:hypothetical protein